MKGIILLQDGFEDIEALITIDMLRRAGIIIDIVSMKDELDVISQSKVTFTCDMLVKNVHASFYDFLVLPGGGAVAAYHLDSMLTKDLVMSFVKDNKLICGICAAPSVFGVCKLLDNIEYTCFPGFEKYMPNGIYKDAPVVTSGNIITGKAAGSTFEFAHAIIKYLKSEELASKVLSSVFYAN